MQTAIEALKQLAKQFNESVSTLTHKTPQDDYARGYFQGREECRNDVEEILTQIEKEKTDG